MAVLATQVLLDTCATVSTDAVSLVEDGRYERHTVDAHRDAEQARLLK